MCNCFSKNLGLGEGSALPVGVPVPWPSATPPTGWLKCNGAAFTASQYPKLALTYPALKLPDLRGEFIRGWDDGRGIDAGRTLLTDQADELRSHNHRFINEYGTPSTNFIAFTDQNSEGVDGGLREGSRAWTYITMEKTGGSETRPHNVAFNYIVRAA
ncbi:tail fiber protein [Yersinia alsatica]|uniref:tail fiber protein n=1 Tax=Yersinia alsatica TaxID=2890317 RepID=UPI0032EB531F